MIKPLICSLLLFNAATAVSAQSATPIARTSADTTQAIHHLFYNHRVGGWIWTGVGAAFTIRIFAAGASASNTSGTLVGAAVFGVMPAAIGIGKLSRFSQAKEAQTIALYEKTKMLPPYVQRRLKKKYFKL